MKKKCLLGGIIAFLIVVIGFGLYALDLISSPEYTLKQAIDSVHQNGIAGLEAYTTEEAWNTVSNVTNIAGTGMTYLSVLGGNTALDQVRVFLDKCSELEWKLKDVMKGKTESAVVLAFNYQNFIRFSFFLGGGGCKPKKALHLMLLPHSRQIHKFSPVWLL